MDVSELRVFVLLKMSTSFSPAKEDEKLLWREYWRGEEKMLLALPLVE